MHRERALGWAQVALAGLAMVATLPGRTQGLGLVTEPLLADLRVDRVSYAMINLWATLAGSLFCLPCGRLTDRYGSRAVLTVVAALLGASVIGMSGAAGIVGLCAGITLSRGLGQSALSVVSLALVGKWFGRRLNKAMGIYSALVGMGFIAAFPLVGAAVLRFGWRASWSSIGWTLVAVVAPLAWIVVRNAPADRSVEFGPAGESDEAPGDLTLREALQGWAFWLFAGSSAMFGLVYSGIALFNQSILEQRGFDAPVYHTALAVSAMVGLAANFGGGWLLSKWPIQRVMGIGMGLLAGAVLWLPLVSSYEQVMLYGMTMGASGGVVTVVFFSVWGKVYGSSHLGKIQGCAQMMTVVASATGPLLLAEALERTGSYDRMFYGLAAAVAAMGMASWMVALPSRGLRKALAAC